jgi:hypothetical protein
MSGTTTIEIPASCHLWWRSCCKAKGVSSQKLFMEFREVVRRKKQQEFYQSLVMPSDYKKDKPLSGKKIDKSYRNKEFVI